MVPDGWEDTKFGNVADFRNGLNFTSVGVGESIKVIGIPFFSNREVADDFGSLQPVTLSGRIGDDDLLQDGDLLFVRSNGNKDLIGRCLLLRGVSEPLSFSGFTIRARVSTNKARSDFIAYLTRSPLVQNQIRKLGGGTNISNLSQAILSNLSLLLPPIGEQKKIVEILSTWDRAIETVEKLIENAEQQRAGLSSQMLGGEYRLPEFAGDPWRSLPLGDAAEFVRDGTHGTHARVDEGVPMISAANVLPNGTIDFDAAPSIPPEDYSAIHKKYEIQENDTLLTVVGTLGRVAIVPECKRFTAQRSVAIIRPGARLNHRYLGHVCSSAAFQRELKKRANVTAQPGVYLAELGKIPIPVLRMVEQERIARILDTSDEEHRLLVSGADSLRREKTALMQQLLTGERRVKVGKEKVA